MAWPVKYLICATPRTGSYLLCEGLQNTGVAGRPTEYLSLPFETYWRPRWGADEYLDYLERVRRTGTTENGVFGAKVHPIQFDHFCRRMGGSAHSSSEVRQKFLDDAFPDLRYVWLRRRDKLRQGVSYAKALQSRMWWDSEHPPAPYDRARPDAVQFDRVLIERSVTQMHLEDLSWSRYFDDNRIEPLELWFEDWIGDVSGAVTRVLDFLDIDPPVDPKLPPSQFRRQANLIDDRWLERLARVSIAEPAIKWARSHEPPAPRPQTEAPATLEGALQSRKWWRVRVPFAHVRAENVFVPELYLAMQDQYRAWRTGGHFTRNIPGYDVTAMNLHPDGAGPFAVFCSREWHDMLARMFRVEATGEVNITLHHHDAGSRSGVPHNDLNPGFFAEDAARHDGIAVSDPKQCNYRTGAGPGGMQAIERVRAVAVIFYLGSVDGGPSGGETGLYRSVTDPVHAPAVAVRPKGNSLVAFECTPFSFHSFIRNPEGERETLVMWLHRPRAEAVRRWGEGSIVRW